jgi:hypothetical protein
LPCNQLLKLCGDKGYNYEPSIQYSTLTFPTSEIAGNKELEDKLLNTSSPSSRDDHVKQSEFEVHTWSQTRGKGVEDGGKVSTTP